VAHHWVVELPVLQYLQRYRVGGAFDGQITVQRVAVCAARLDAGALEGDRRELVDLEKVRRRRSLSLVSLWVRMLTV
jgi:hypothetical protein